MVGKVTTISVFLVHEHVKLWTFLKLELELFDLQPKIIDDFLVLADMNRDQFFICDLLGFYVFCSISVFQGIDCLFKLTAGWADVCDHNCFTVSS